MSLFVCGAISKIFARAFDFLKNPHPKYFFFFSGFWINLHIY